MTERPARGAEPGTGDGVPVAGGARAGGAPGPRKPGRFVKRGGRGGLGLFLLANAVPVGAAVWWFTRSADSRQAVLDQIPSGVASRAAAAGLCFVALLVLARVVLPAANGAVKALRAVRGRMRQRRGAARVLLLPVEGLVGLLELVCQILFSVDAILVLAAAALFILYVIRIVKPDTFPWLPG